MNAKTIISGIVAGIVMFFAGYLIYGVIMTDYFMSNMPSYPGLMKQQMDIWAIGVGNIVWGILLAWVLNSAGISSASGGASFGAVAFFLYSLGSAFVAYGQMNMYGIQSIFVEALCMAVMAAFGGAAAGWMLGRLIKN